MNLQTRVLKHTALKAIFMTIQKKAIMISEILMKDGDKSIIAEYSLALLKEIKKVEEYIKKIMVIQNTMLICASIT